MGTTGNKVHLFEEDLVVGGLLFALEINIFQSNIVSLASWDHSEHAGSPVCLDLIVISKREGSFSSWRTRSAKFWRIMSNNLKRRTENREEGEEIWGNQFLVKKKGQTDIHYESGISALSPALAYYWCRRMVTWFTFSTLVPKYSFQCVIATCYPTFGRNNHHSMCYVWAVQCQMSQGIPINCQSDVNNNGGRLRDISG